MWKKNKKYFLQSSFIFLLKSYWYLQIISTEEPGLTEHNKSEYRCHGNEGKRGISNHLLYGTAFLPGWSFVSQFGLRLVQCLPWEGEGQVPDGEEGALSGEPQAILFYQNDFSLAAQQCCFNQTQNEAELSPFVVLFKLFWIKPVPSQGLSCLKCSFLFRVWGRAGAGRTVAEVLHGRTFVHLLVFWMCVAWGSRLPSFPHGSANSALCCRAVS